MTDYVPNYKATSLYKATSIGPRFMGQYIHRPVLPHELDQVLVISKAEYHLRPDLFALDYYGHEDWFWIVPVRSGFQDLVFDFTLGAKIIVPDPQYIKDQFQS